MSTANTNKAALSPAAKPHLAQFQKEELLCMAVLTDFAALLRRWKKDYAPKTEYIPARYVRTQRTSAILICIAAGRNWISWRETDNQRIEVMLLKLLECGMMSAQAVMLMDIITGNLTRKSSR